MHHTFSTYCYVLFWRFLFIYYHVNIISYNGQNARVIEQILQISNNPVDV